MCKAIDAARYLVYYSSVRNTPINNSILQKLLYYSQGMFLSEKNERLFDDDIVAWNCGPCIVMVHHHYSESLSDPLSESAPSSLYNWQSDFLDIALTLLGKSDTYEITSTMNKLISETKMHLPWIKTFNNGLGYEKVISIDLITEFFKNNDIYNNLAKNVYE